MHKHTKIAHRLHRQARKKGDPHSFRQFVRHAVLTTADDRPVKLDSPKLREIRRGA